jgi:hypothetical protein
LFHAKPTKDFAKSARDLFVFSVKPAFSEKQFFFEFRINTGRFRHHYEP